MPTRALLIIAIAISLGCNSNSNEDSNSNSTSNTDSQVESADQRTFKFVYGAALTDLEPGTSVKVWLPVATSNHEQQVELVSTNLPAEFQRTREKKFGNELIYFEATANDHGEVPVEVTYLVTRNELTPDNYEPASEGQETTFLQANTLVPTTDELRISVLGDAVPTGKPIEVAKVLYDGVDSFMKYDKPADQPGWGNGDSQWACNNGFGNCTDFHSLFISTARNLEIPARFEIGFPIPTEIGSGEVGGYHCWAKFLADKKWVPVDISEADKHPEMKSYYFGNLTADRVTFSVGRDLELEPATTAKSVNYLSYPYAEVDGKQHKRFRKAFRYEDVQK